MLSLGPVHLKFPVLQAPLSGYSDPPMRRVARRLGAEFTFAEVMLDRFVVEVSGGKKAHRYVDLHDREHPCGGQLMGSDAREMVPAARKLVEWGFDVIDLNFACPVKKVIGKKRGGDLLRRPKKALEIVERLRDALPDSVPLTVKLRRGFDDSPESRNRFWEILTGAYECGVAAVTLHGRTVLQRYTGRSDWGFVRRVKEEIGDRVLLGSGDLLTAPDCVKRLHESGVDGVSVARGAIGNPWIFAQIRALLRGESLPEPPSVREQGEVLGEHFHLSLECYGAQRACRVMRKFALRYARLHPLEEEVSHAFLGSDSPEKWLAVLDRFYRDDMTGRQPSSGEALGE
jgi:nifR3 family TIM-barrel protein